MSFNASNSLFEANPLGFRVDQFTKRLGKLKEYPISTPFRPHIFSKDAEIALFTTIIGQHLRG